MRRVLAILLVLASTSHVSATRSGLDPICVGVVVRGGHSAPLSASALAAVLALRRTVEHCVEATGRPPHGTHVDADLAIGATGAVERVRASGTHALAVCIRTHAPAQAFSALGSPVTHRLRFAIGQHSGEHGACDVPTLEPLPLGVVVEAADLVDGSLDVDALRRLFVTRGAALGHCVEATGPTDATDVRMTVRVAFDERGAVTEVSTEGDARDADACVQRIVRGMRLASVERAAHVRLVLVFAHPAR